jgi:hypothetical protein
MVHTVLGPFIYHDDYIPLGPPLLTSRSRYGIPTIGRYGILVTQFYEFWESCTEDFDSDYWGGVCVSNCCGDTQCLFPRRSILWLSLTLTVCLTLDFSGSLTYIGCTALSLYLPALRARSLAKSQGLPIPSFPPLSSFHPRQLIVSGLTLLWAFRLGSFLFQRVLKAGGDSRFDKLKKRVRCPPILLITSERNFSGFGSVRLLGYR